MALKDIERVLSSSSFFYKQVLSNETNWGFSINQTWFWEINSKVFWELIIVALKRIEAIRRNNDRDKIQKQLYLEKLDVMQIIKDIFEQ